MTNTKSKSNLCQCWPTVPDTFPRTEQMDEFVDRIESVLASSNTPERKLEQIAYILEEQPCKVPALSCLASQRFLPLMLSPLRN